MPASFTDDITVQITLVLQLDYWGLIVKGDTSRADDDKTEYKTMTHGNHGN